VNVGMLWLDDDKRTTIEEKVKRAADFYLHKFGRAPDTCLVNKRILKEELHVGSIQVSPARNVLPNHLWIGNDSS
jgi:hypothetical protein